MAADKKPGPDAVTSDVTFDPAVAWFQKRLGMTRAQVNRLTLDARRKVFFVTGLSDLELIKSVQDSLARSIENGSTFEEWKKEVKEKKLFQGPEFTHRRLETIFRTNMQNAFATGRYMEMTAPAVLKRRPYWRFSAVRDGRTTKVCAAAHGTILPANHPWWKTHIPPLHFNCRSTFVPMTEKDAKAAGITKTPTELDSALGFGNPPDGVPADAKDMPTEEEQKAKDAEAAKVRDEIEKAKAASSESTQANRQLTAARNERKEAEKAVRKASGDEIGPASDHLLETKRQEEEARRKAEAKKQKKAQAEENARKATDKGAPRNWEPTEKEVKRRFGAFGRIFASMMRGLETLVHGAGGESLLMPGTMRRRALIANQLGFAAFRNPNQKTPWEKIIEQVQKEKRIGKSLTNDEIETAKRWNVLPKDMSKIASPKSKHILNKKIRLKGKLCSFVPESRASEVDSDFEDIVSGKIQPIWKETVDSQGKNKLSPVYKGRGGILYRFGQGKNANTLAIVGGTGVTQVIATEIDALCKIFKDGMSIEKACKAKGVQDVAKIQRIAELIKE